MKLSNSTPSVIHEDNHVIVVSKPPLMATMGVQSDEDSLVKWTRAWLKKKYQKPGNVYLGVVSRLDAFTSGLVVFARTSKAASRLTRQFQSGEVSKQYTAILEGRLADRQGRLVDWVRKDDGQRRMVVVPAESTNAKRAELTYDVSGYAGQQTLVHVNLLTGRKHQIRVQFANLGHPVLGDRKYDGLGPFRPGIALQSSSLIFEHPVKRIELNFQIDPPEAWKLARFTGK